MAAKYSVTVVVKLEAGTSIYYYATSAVVMGKRIRDLTNLDLWAPSITPTNKNKRPYGGSFVQA